MDSTTEEIGFGLLDIMEKRLLSRRDAFAAAALTGILAQHTEDGNATEPAWEVRNPGDCRIVAEAAYRIADAMMQAATVVPSERETQCQST